MRYVFWFFLGLMALLYIAAGVNHFVNPEFYTRIMPPYLPAHLALVYLSGVFEIVLGVLLLPPQTRRLAAWGIIAMLIVFMIVHLHMLVHAEDQFADVPYALIVARIPLQGVLVFWAWWYTRKRD